MSLVINPVAFIFVAMHVPKSAVPVGLIVTPFALVASTINPDLHSATVSVVSIPLTQVSSAILKDELGAIFNLSVVCLTSFKLFVNGTSWGISSISSLQLFLLHKRSVRCEMGHISTCSSASSPSLKSDDQPDMFLEVLLYKGNKSRVRINVRKY